jgi:hypothetical protein
MTAQEKAFIELIKNHRGLRNTITSGEIARYLQIKDKPGHMITRAFIRKTIIEHGLPVGGSETGYYWLDSINDLNTYRANLIGRINKIAERLEKVEEYYYQAQRQAQAEKEQDGQLRLIAT